MQPDEDGTNKTVSFFVKGMTCMSCVRKIEAALSECPGVGDVVVGLAEQKVTAGFDPVKTSLDDLKAVVEAAGYSIIENKSDNLDETISRQRLLSKQVFSPPPLADRGGGGHRCRWVLFGTDYPGFRLVQCQDAV